MVVVLKQVLGQVLRNLATEVLHGNVCNIEVKSKLAHHLLSRGVVIAVEHVALLERHVADDAVVVVDEVLCQHTERYFMLTKLLHELGKLNRWKQILTVVPRVRPALHPVVDSLAIVDHRLVLGMVCQQVLDVATR